jgi:2-phosphosulfolactate phosphatase
MRTVDVCLSPDMMHLYEIGDRTVVVVDILRATSCMVTAFAHGVHHIIPFANLENCLAMKTHGYITSGERNGSKVDGFDKGNSPFEYMEGMRGAKLAFTTTNGTEAIDRSSKAKEIVIGSFLNLTAVADHLLAGSNNVLILCAGWKGKVNMEDTLFAGALVSLIREQITPECDAPRAAHHLYAAGKNDMVGFLSDSSHVRRLARLDITEDIGFCLTPDQYKVVPVLEGSALTLKIV